MRVRVRARVCPGGYRLRQIIVISLTGPNTTTGGARTGGGREWCRRYRRARPAPARRRRRPAHD